MQRSIFLSITNIFVISKKNSRQGTFPFIKRRIYRSFQILTYHRVNDEKDPFFTGVPVRVFAAQMEKLQAYFNVLPLEQLLEGVEKGDIPPNAIAITFDDGYRDNFENAYPVLRHFGLPATIFLRSIFLNALMISYFVLTRIIKTGVLHLIQVYAWIFIPVQMANWIGFSTFYPEMSLEIFYTTEMLQKQVNTFAVIIAICMLGFIISSMFFAIKLLFKSSQKEVLKI